MFTVEHALGVLHSFRNGKYAEFQRMFKDKWYSDFIESVTGHVVYGKALSTYQASTVLKLLKRAEPMLVEHGYVQDGQITKLISYPIYNKMPYESSNMPREVRYVGDNMLAFRFKFNDTLIKEFSSLRMKSGHVINGGPRKPTSDNAFFHKTLRLWFVRVNRDTIQSIMSIIKRYRFDFDDATVDYLALAENSKSEESTFVYDPESEMIVANVCDNEIISMWVSTILNGEVI